MKKVVRAVLFFAMIIFILTPLSSNAGSGSSGRGNSSKGQSGSSHSGSGHSYSSGYHTSGSHSSGHSRSGHSYSSGYRASGHSGSGHSYASGSYSGGYHSRGYHGRGYHSSGYRWNGGYWGWWAPWTIYGGLEILGPYDYPYYYSPYYPPPLVDDQEQPLVYAQPAPSVSPSTDERIFVYPRKGQSEEQQTKDRYECHRWGVSQTGYDPTQPTSDMPQDQLRQMRADYKRAMSACLDARGYTMK